MPSTIMVSVTFMTIITLYFTTFILTKALFKIFSLSLNAKNISNIYILASSFIETLINLNTIYHESYFTHYYSIFLMFYKAIILFIPFYCLKYKIFDFLNILSNLTFYSTITTTISGICIEYILKTKDFSHIIKFNIALLIQIIFFIIYFVILKLFNDILSKRNLQNVFFADSQRMFISFWYIVSTAMLLLDIYCSYQWIFINKIFIVSYILKAFIFTFGGSLFLNYAIKNSELLQNDIQLRYELDIEKKISANMLGNNGKTYDINFTKKIFNDLEKNIIIPFEDDENENKKFILKKFEEVYVGDIKALVDFFELKNLLKLSNELEKKHCIEYRINENKKFIWYKATVTFTKLNTDLIGRVFIENIDEIKRYEKQLKYKSEHDIMTGVYNKGALTEYLNKELKTQAGIFFMMDIDNFKKANDTKGHDVGDMLIKYTADKLKTIFAPRDIIGRFGGDEFVVYMILEKDMTTKDIKTLVNTKVNLLLNIYKDVDDIVRDIDISLSIGVVMNVNLSNTATFDEYLKKADEAMYTTKKNGKNGFTFMYN